jgi:4-carboxymuconolactone decarboxylase
MSDPRPEMSESTEPETRDPAERELSDDARVDREDPYQAGMRVRRDVLGDEHVDRAIERTSAFTAPVQEYITRSAWGAVWARDGLDRRTRSAVTLAVLTALGRENEIEMHVRAGLRNGLTPSEIAEVLLHTAVYAGVPAANSAFAAAQRVIDGPSSRAG